MGTGWRRAFCTTIPRDHETTTALSDKQSPSPSPSPRACAKLSFFSSSSNPSTPRLQSQPVKSPSMRCERSTGDYTPRETNKSESPRLQCKTTTPKSSKSPRTKLGSNPSSPRSPLKLSLFKNSFKFRSSCGICLNSVKTGQGKAIYTAECTHAFHFPCIAAHVRKHNTLICPVCNAAWKDVSLLSAHANNLPAISKVEEKKIVVESSTRTPTSQQRALSESKSYYNDDEPLLSPTSGARFIPIPEANEEDNEFEDESNRAEEEFQGFFVNPCVKSDQVPVLDYRTVEVKVLPESAVISSNRNSETYAVVLRLKAPPPPPRLGGAANRAPIDLVTVLDVSGSMTGSKLNMLKRAMRLVISSLGSADRLSIVAFSSSPKRLLPLRRMTGLGQKSARRIIDRLVCGQGTSVGEALRKATKVLEDRRERNPVASIMLLSDGQDDRVNVNSSTQRYGSSQVSSTRFSHIEIPVHSSGFGRNGGFSNEPREDAFAKCVGGLLSVVVQDVRVQLGFGYGSAQGEIAAVYSCNGKPTALNGSSIRLSDLYAEEERELLLELRVPFSASGSHHVLNVKCSYKDPSTQEIVYGRDQAVLVPRPHVVRSSSPKIQRLRDFFIATRAVAEARRLVESGDFTSSHQLLASSRALLLQSSSGSAEEYVRGLEAELAELQLRRQRQVEQQQIMMMVQRRKDGVVVDENGEPLTPSSAWRAAEKLAKVAVMKKSANRVSDLHGFENARF